MFMIGDEYETRFCSGCNSNVSEPSDWWLYVAEICQSCEAYGIACAQAAQTPRGWDGDEPF